MSQTEPSAAASFAQTTIRLHISPLDADLLPIIIPAPLLALARNVSFHTLETFPEKRYAFVDLPVAEAEGLRKKLHGAILKGMKMRVEKARPDSIPIPSGEEADTADGDKQKKRKSKPGIGDDSGGAKKRKRTDGVYDGIELRGRKIKRLWTVPEERGGKKSKTKQRSGDMKDRTKPQVIKSKYTDHPEVLLRKKMPHSPSAISDEVAKEKKSKKRASHVVMHEFEKTKRFPSFLKTGPESAEPSPEFVEGKGWVDKAGNVVQAVKARARVSKKEGATKAETRATPQIANATDDDDDNGDNGDNVEDEDDEDDEDDDEDEDGDDDEDDDEDGDDGDDDDDETSSSGTSSEGSDSVPEHEDHGEKTTKGWQEPTTPYASKPEPPTIVPPSPATSNKLDSARPISASSVRSLIIKIPSSVPATDVHPLEALYKKKPVDGASGANRSEGKATTGSPEPFTFFGPDSNIAEDKDAVLDTDDAGPAQPPMTPFTKQAFEWRRQRSAAPTPDTAHPTRASSFLTESPANGHPEGDGDEAEDVGENGQGEAGDGAGGSQGATPSGSGSSFQSWFWENRSSLNRSWKDRRKAAAKEKRQKDNKARSSWAL